MNNPSVDDIKIGKSRKYLTRLPLGLSPVGGLGRSGACGSAIKLTDAMACVMLAQSTVEEVGGEYGGGGLSLSTEMIFRSSGYLRK